MSYGKVSENEVYLIKLVIMLSNITLNSKCFLPPMCLFLLNSINKTNKQGIPNLSLVDGGEANLRTKLEDVHKSCIQPPIISTRDL